MAPVRYRISVRGRLTERLGSAFDDMIPCHARAGRPPALSICWRDHKTHEKPFKYRLFSVRPPVSFPSFSRSSFAQAP